MKTIQSDIIIIGAGLTGLAIAYLLKQKGITTTIIEARERLGGRIYTKYKDQDNTAAQEMGATWLGKKHSYLVQLLDELKIDIFEQVLGESAIYEPISTSPHQLVTLPPNSDPSYRIKGGSTALINALVQQLEAHQIYLGQVVKSIEKNDNDLTVQSATHHFKAPIVISTLPPCLFAKMIKVSPALPDTLLEVAEKTHTWMGESIKVLLTYKTPFWRDKDTSGTIFSNVGPIPEMYDHSNYEDSFFALKGFFNGAYFSITKEERLQLVLRQLRKYFGTKADNFLTYEETVWRNEPFTFANYTDHILPHQNNGHPIYQNAYLEGKLFIAGSETASDFPGYMEGAVRSARFVVGQLEIFLEV